MYNITVGRFREDPSAQGVIRPEDDSWQLVIDKDGYPHLHLRVNFEPEIIEGSEHSTGFLCIEDLLPHDCTIADLMKGHFGGKLSPEEEAEAIREYTESRERTGIPCPR